LPCRCRASRSHDYVLDFACVDLPFALRLRTRILRYAGCLFRLPCRLLILLPFALCGRCVQFTHVYLLTLLRCCARGIALGALPRLRLINTPRSLPFTVAGCVCVATVALRSSILCGGCRYVPLRCYCRPTAPHIFWVRYVVTVLFVVVDGYTFSLGTHLHLYVRYIPRCAPPALPLRVYTLPAIFTVHILTLGAWCRFTCLHVYSILRYRAYCLVLTLLFLR